MEPWIGTGTIKQIFWEWEPETKISKAPVPGFEFLFVLTANIIDNFVLHFVADRGHSNIM